MLSTFSFSFFEPNNLLPSTQSEFLPFHSTETSLLKIYNDSLHSWDKGKISLLLCLDFSSAFDTVDHSLLIQQLATYFEISGSCLKWIPFFISNRSFLVSINNFHSFFSPFSVFHGSLLGPLLFILYTSELPRIISSFSFRVNFMLMTLTASLPFSNMNHLLLSPKFLLVLVK